MNVWLKTHVRLLCVIGNLGLAGVIALAISASGISSSVASGRPKLAVLVVFDQLRGDYLQRWKELFGEDGFRRLQREGTWFTNCHYPYGFTVTAAGHASVLTGASPDRHGIVGNEWYEREAGGSIYCVGTDRYEQVPPRSTGSKKTYGVYPGRLLVPTLGDAMRGAFGVQCKIIGISFKDRSAVLPAGQRPTACFWFDSDNATVCTSTYYMERLPGWVAAFNAARPADRWFGQDWNRLKTDINYVRYSGVDDEEGEGTGFKQGRTFPHPMSAGLAAPAKQYYQAMYNSPFGNELILQLTKQAIDAEELGKHDHPDLLCVSFSCNDSVGHTWGPDSQEVLDVTLRADEIMRELLAHLDAKVGRGNYVLAMTADHGVCPLPEVSQAEGRPAGRASLAQLAVDAEAFLCSRYSPVGGSARWFEDAQHVPWIFLNRPLLKELKIDEAEFERTLARWLETQPGVARVYTRAQLAGLRPPDEDEREWKSFNNARCGDLTITLKPYWIWAMPFSGGTNHGSPHSYDTHVPLIFYGTGISTDVRTDPVTPQAIPAVLAQLLGIAPPAGAEAPVPSGLLAK
jgi:hypothetical protein